MIELAFEDHVLKLMPATARRTAESQIERSGASAS